MRFLIQASAVALLGPACGGGGGSGSSAPPTAPRCTQVGGSWQYSWQMPPCGGAAAGSGSLVVAQSACSVSFVVPELGALQGEIAEGRQVRNFSLVFAATAPGAGAGCTDMGAAGLQPFTSTRATFLFGENATVGCCRHGNLELSR
jgi:hypothetical protein